MAVANEETEEEHSLARLSDPETRMETEGHKGDFNQGWADAMSKILQNQLPEDKPPVLVKYKKVEKRKAEMKEEKVTKKLKSQERHAMFEKDHIVPDGSTMDFEKKLAKIATRGVVKLFNAVSKHQKEMESKLKSAPTEVKKSKVVESMSKSAFLDMLKSTSDKPRTEELDKRQEIQVETDATSSWNILRDDFMMGAKMKDWNQEEQQSKKKDKKLTNIADHELGKNADFFEESDEDDNADDEDEESDEESDEG